MSRLAVLLLVSFLSLPLALWSGDSQGYPRVYRTFMPESGPSAFAVELSPTLALCYDPLRGGLTRVWKGGVDLAPTLRAKINAPAELVGEPLYILEGTGPLRLGEAEAAEYRFLGYQYLDGAVLFRYRLNGHEIRETLRTDDSGGGLISLFELPEAGGHALLRLGKSVQAEIRVEGGEEIQAGLWRLPAGSRTALHIRPKASHD